MAITGFQPVWTCLKNCPPTPQTKDSETENPGNDFLRSQTKKTQNTGHDSICDLFIPYSSWRSRNITIEPVTDSMPNRSPACGSHGTLKTCKPHGIGGSKKKNNGQQNGRWFYLVGGFNPFEKYSQNGSLPQIFGVNVKNLWVATT